MTGKPMPLGGSVGRRDATGRGVDVAGCEAAIKCGMRIEGARVAVQGFGNVGGIAARLFSEAGALVVAVQDHGGTIVHEGGLDVAALLAYVAQMGSRPSGRWRRTRTCP